MKIGFWNTFQNDIDVLIADWIYEKQLDLIALAEYNNSDVDKLLLLLKRKGLFYNYINTPGCDRIKWLTRDCFHYSLGVQNTYYSYLIDDNNRVFCSLHLPSNLHADSRDRNLVVRELVYDLLELETNLNTNKSLVFGDFNEDPYDDNLLNAADLHALPDAVEAKRIKRIIKGHSYKMFYNPMWNCLGDNTFPSGTYYSNKSIAKQSFWHVYDQVLIRPSLIDGFKTDCFSIITSINNTSLLNSKNKPDHSISDHLPIVFEMEF